MSALTGKQLLKIWFPRALLTVLAAAIIAFGVDAAVLRYRISNKSGALGSVTVRPYYAVPLKDKKIEYMFDDPQDETCVNSLFPHMGYSPCWYLQRHRQREML
jgi:hypothetical protein